MTPEERLAEAARHLTIAEEEEGLPPEYQDELTHIRRQVKVAQAAVEAWQRAPDRRGESL